MTVQGILLNQVDFQDYSKIVTIFCKKGIFSVIAEGINKPTAKNRSGLLFFTLSEIEVFLKTSTKVGKLKKATKIKFFQNIYTNENILKDGYFLLSIVRQLEFNESKYEKTFDLLLNHLEMLNNLINQDFVVFSFLFNLLKIQNINFNTKECVRTGVKSDIISINLHQGGFISKKAFDPKQEQILDSKILKAFKQVNEINEKELLNYNLDVCKILLKLIIDFYKESLGFFV